MMIRALTISLVAVLLAAPAFAALPVRDEGPAPVSQDGIQASRQLPGLAEVNDERQPQRFGEVSDNWCRTIPAACPRRAVAEVNDERPLPR